MIQTIYDSCISFFSSSLVLVRLFQLLPKSLIPHATLLTGHVAWTIFVRCFQRVLLSVKHAATAQPTAGPNVQHV